MGSGESRTCPFCSGPMAPGATRCEYCGNEVRAAPQPSSPAAQPPVPVAAEQPRSPAALLAVAIAGALLVAGVAMGLFFMAAESGPSGSPAPSVVVSPAVPTPRPAAPPTPIALGTPTTGVFVPGLPVDAGGYPYLDYVVPVTTPGIYAIDLISGNTSSYDPYLRLLRDGVEVAVDDDGGDGLNSRLSYFLQAGTYVVRVSKFGTGQVSAPAPFTLTVTPPAAPVPTVPPPSPAALPGEPETPGFTSAAVEETYRSAVCGTILECYRENEAFGSVNLTLEVDIREDGRVRSQRFQGESPPSAVRRCIRRQLGSLTIPSYQGGPARITCRYAGTLMIGGMMMSQGSSFDPR